MPSEVTPLVKARTLSSDVGGISRDLGLARDAFEGRDANLSRQAHQAKAPQRSGEEGHRGEGSLIKSVVFGGLDGILTTFAIVSSATGGGFSTLVILILGFSSKFGDALAMGLGDALSTKAEHEHIRREREREYWEYDNYPEGEIQEMIELYESRGMTKQDAEQVIRLMAPHRDFFVDIMMVEELGMQVPGDDENPWFDGFVTFVSFIFFGFFPLLGYCIFPFLFPSMSREHVFQIACLMSGLTLFLLGAIKSLFSVKSWWRSGFEMLCVGYSVCFVAWAIAKITAITVGVDPRDIE